MKCHNPRSAPEAFEGRRESHLAIYDLRYTAADGIHVSQGEKRILLGAHFHHAPEIRLGRSGREERRLLLVHGDECPQLDADYILIQPEAVSADPRRGWLPLGGLYPSARSLGAEDTPELELGEDVDPDHAYVSVTSEGIYITDGSTSKTEVRAHPDDVVGVFS